MISSMTPQLFVKIEGLLKTTTDRAEAKSIYVCDRGGSIISMFSRVERVDSEDNMAALAAGSFFATQELARLLGEPGFQCVFHQGSSSSVYMQNMAGDMLMLVVFGRDSNAGLVRLYANQASKNLEQLFAAAEQEALSAPADAGGGFGMQFEIDETAQPFFKTS